MYPRIYVAPTSKNVIDSVIELVNTYKAFIGLIASRRQIDISGGYVGINTREFNSLVTSRSDTTFICRDHGGPMQLYSSPNDDGLASFDCDLNYLDIIHIDPWKLVTDDFQYGIDLTISAIQRLSNLNPYVSYEVGTEEAIYAYSPDQLYQLLSALKRELGDQFNLIDYACIQSGVGLDIYNARNIGKFDRVKLVEFIGVCKHFGVRSKEHNGDYLFDNQISERYSLGVDAINFAPEIARIESTCIWEYFVLHEYFEFLNIFYNLCLDFAPWQKWFGPELINDKEKFCRATGHYVLNHPEMKRILLESGIDNEVVKTQIKNRIIEISNLI